MTYELRALVLAGATLGAVHAQKPTLPFDAAEVVFDENTCVRHVVDLDGDGRPEALGWWFVNSLRNSMRVAAMRRDPNGAWSTLWTQTETVVSGGEPWAETPMVVADFNGDGRMDWAMALARVVRVFTSPARRAVPRGCRIHRPANPVLRAGVLAAGAHGHRRLSRRRVQSGLPAGPTYSRAITRLSNSTTLAACLVQRSVT